MISTSFPSTSDAKKAELSVVIAQKKTNFVINDTLKTGIMGNNFLACLYREHIFKFFYY